MDPLCSFFTSHLTEIYFFYGLAFFITGIVVGLEASRHSDMSLARALPFLASFGLLHGAHEWAEMFEKLAPGPVGPVPRLFRLTLLVFSFIPLVEFGVRLGGLTGGKRWRFGRWVVLVIFFAGAGLVWLRWGSEGLQAWIPALDAWSRYSLAVPGSILAAIGLYIYGGRVKRGRPAIPCDLQVVALALLVYGVPGQVFVGASVLPPSTVINGDLFLGFFHFPVQLLRTLMATLTAIFMGRGVRCFERERRERTEKLNRERLEAQQRLTEEMAQRRRLQRELLHRTVQAQEEERRHIARELHDETAQALTALSLGLAGAEEAVAEDSVEARDRLLGLRVLVEDIMKRVNELTTRLRPTMLDDLGLIPALITYADTLDRRLPFTVDVNVTGCRRRLPSELETAVYRIVQESLTNVARHAQAGHAWVQLDLGPREVILKVADDGIGMSGERAEEAVARGEGWGLAGIHERAALLGGDVIIRSEPGAGTEIEARIPIPGSRPREGQGS
jgi:signal transduction histidine kinase